jgi:Uma2 family endonuclease
VYIRETVPFRTPRGILAMIHAGFDTLTEEPPEVSPPAAPSSSGPVWEIATLYPPQGSWTVEAYLELTDTTNRLIEFSDGHLEFLAMPSRLHQRLVKRLLLLLETFVVARRLGEVLTAGMRVRTAETQFKLPDVVFLSEANEARWGGDRFWEGADVALEVVGRDDRSVERDYGVKLTAYAAAGIPEYWVVDPQQSKVAVHTLPEGGTAYALHGEFSPGQQATSKLLEGFEVDVAALFASAKE